MKIRTRYAPSPTGFLHIGGARTALFNYLFAKHNNGDFILRIEDTDQARNVLGGEQSQISNLEWLGIEIDESPVKPGKFGPYRQSEKLERYLKIAQLLIEKGWAYYAYDNSQELEAQKKEQMEKGIFSFRYNKNWLQIDEQEKQRRFAQNEYVIRFAIPENVKYLWDDLVRGEIEVESSSIGDWVLVKSDGFPTYNFAVVVDDHDMEISHIFRGEEHISNTPKQIALYQALNWEIPKFGHLTIITDSQGKKLSKRDKSLFQFIEDYKNEGFSSQALFNFLALLGWTSPDAKEIFTKEELIKAFDYTRLSKAPTKFDIDKLKWFSKNYISAMTSEQIAAILKFDAPEQWVKTYINVYQKSAITFKDFVQNYSFFNTPAVQIEQQIEQLLNSVDQKPIIEFANKINFDNWSVEHILEVIKSVGEELNIKGKQLLLPIRLATTWAQSGPELAVAIWLMGAQTIKKRLKKWM
ncbi:glutamate--tRNA ligase [Mesomycoplasma conjunctivae]|uniref:glutamate--tRNA ligase n=1 Tax=Mesomycoplasma conjunctivae TaxID=45361 RepID=UPI003DA4B5C0